MGEAAQQTLADAIWNGFKASGLALDKTPVLSVWISPDNCFAYVEFVSPADATTAMNLDGMDFLGQQLRIARPRDYIENPPAGAAATMALEKALGIDPEMVRKSKIQCKFGLVGGRCFPDLILLANAFVLAGICLCGACSCHESHQSAAGGGGRRASAPTVGSRTPSVTTGTWQPQL